MSGRIRSPNSERRFVRVTGQLIYRLLTAVCARSGAIAITPGGKAAYVVNIASGIVTSVWSATSAALKRAALKAGLAASPSPGGETGGRAIPWLIARAWHQVQAWPAPLMLTVD